MKGKEKEGALEREERREQTTLPIAKGKREHGLCTYHQFKLPLYFFSPPPFSLSLSIYIPSSILWKERKSVYSINYYELTYYP